MVQVFSLLERGAENTRVWVTYSSGRGSRYIGEFVRASVLRTLGDGGLRAQEVSGQLRGVSDTTVKNSNMQGGALDPLPHFTVEKKLRQEGQDPEPASVGSQESSPLS